MQHLFFNYIFRFLVFFLFIFTLCYYSLHFPLFLSLLFLINKNKEICLKRLLQTDCTNIITLSNVVTSPKNIITLSNVVTSPKSQLQPFKHFQHELSCRNLQHPLLLELSMWPCNHSFLVKDSLCFSCTCTELLTSIPEHIKSILITKEGLHMFVPSFPILAIKNSKCVDSP